MQKVVASPRPTGRARNAPPPHLDATFDTLFEPSISGGTGGGGRKRNRRTSSGRRHYAFVRQLIGASLMVAIVTAAIVSDKTRMRRLSEIAPGIDEVAMQAGFGLEQVTLKGQKHSLVADIFDALNLDDVRTFASFDAVGARFRVEALPWIERAEFRRVYPNQLEVSIRERAAFAVWEEAEGKRALIDAEGRVLSRMGSLEQWKSLPRFAGAGAPAHARRMLEDLEAHRELKERVARYERVGARRWSLHLANGAILHLPTTGVAAALDQLRQWPGYGPLLETGRRAVDMRASGRIAVRPLEGIGATSGGPATIADLIDPAG